MKPLYPGRFYVFLLLFLTNCNEGAKNNYQKASEEPVEKSALVGGGCDGCEIMFIGMPENIDPVDTSEGWNEKGIKLLVRGTVFKQGGKIPCPNVIIYYWQTDHKGYYSPGEDMDDLAKRHGHIRGWVKSDQNGKYSIYTIRPAPYPNDSMPAHIHISIKEPDIKNEYYIDEFVFDDDKLLTENKRNRLENRGGSGILKVTSTNEYQLAEHNIILGLHIPDYPE